MIDTDLEVRLAPKPLLAEVLECFQDPAAVLRRHSWTATAYCLALLYPSRLLPVLIERIAAESEVSSCRTCC